MYVQDSLYIYIYLYIYVYICIYIYMQIYIPTNIQGRMLENLYMKREREWKKQTKNERKKEREKHSFSCKELMSLQLVPARKMSTDISFIDFVNTIAPVAVPSLVAECDDIAIHVISLMTIQNVLTFLRAKLCWEDVFDTNVDLESTSRKTVFPLYITSLRTLHSPKKNEQNGIPDV